MINYIHVKSIKNSFFLSDTKLLSVKDIDKVAIISYDKTFEMIWEYNFENSYARIISSENYFILFENKSSFWIKKSDGKLKRIESRLYLHLDKNLKVYIEISKPNELQFNTISGLRTIELKNSNKYFTQNYLTQVIENESIINTVEIDSETYLWEQNFKNYLEGDKIKTIGDIIFFNNFIYLPLVDDANFENKATIEIEMQTGLVKNKYNDFYGKLNLDGNCLYVAQNYEVKKLNLNTGEIKIYDLEKILKPFNLQIHWEKSNFKKDKFYFVDGLWSTTNKFGIIDLFSQKLIWYYELEINDGVNNNITHIEISDSRIYVQTSDETLEIFEQIDSSS